jgi:peptide/nickel transport system ATP-binding protein
LNPVLTCGDQVTEAIQLHKKFSYQDAKRLAIEWFSKVKLPGPANVFNRYPHQLSGGQKQRVMIAIAMCCHPSLLICDEPTTALDVTVQKTILQLIKELQEQENMGVIFITHDLGVVAEIADRAVVMYKGEIVEQGSVKKIFASPQHPYTKALLACRPVNHPRGKRLPVVSDFMKEEIMTKEKRNGHSNLRTKEPIQKPGGLGAGDKLVEVEHLSVWFPSRKTFFGKALEFTKAVDAVSFEVYKGESLGLVGESGCGKTTLGRALLRLIEPTKGKIIYDGVDLTAKGKHQLRSLRKEIQIIFQDPYSSLNPRLTIGSAIAEPLKVHGLAATDKLRKDKVTELLEKVNLKAEHFNRYPHEFSGGQRQRIVIARALALGPSFLVCDESVSALDVSVQAQVLNLLNDLKKEFGFTIIFISHDLSVVRYISDRIMVMNKGKIVETGQADQIYFHPQSEYTKKLIASIPKGLVEG